MGPPNWLRVAVYRISPFVGGLEVTAPPVVVVVKPNQSGAKQPGLNDAVGGGSPAHHETTAGPGAATGRKGGRAEGPAQSRSSRCGGPGMGGDDIEVGLDGQDLEILVDITDGDGRSVVGQLGRWQHQGARRRARRTRRRRVLLHDGRTGPGLDTTRLSPFDGTADRRLEGDWKGSAVADLLSQLAAKRAGISDTLSRGRRGPENRRRHRDQKDQASWSEEFRHGIVPGSMDLLGPTEISLSRCEIPM